MSPWFPAHHPKIDGPSEHDVLMARLLEQYRARVESAFRARDPYSVADRVNVNWRLQLARNAAKAWIREAPKRRRQKLRSGMRLIAGGLR